MEDNNSIRQAEINKYIMENFDIVHPSTTLFDIVQEITYIEDNNMDDSYLFKYPAIYIQ